ncbi:HU family DNA-binding protein [Ottowia pentelensis]
MNKTELIEHIAKNADISKAAATRARSHHRRRQDHAAQGRHGFAGRLWHLRRRQARSSHRAQPRTGATIKIKSAKVPKFRPGKALKDALN